MKAIVIGANGQLGGDLVEALEAEVIPLNHSDIELADSNNVASVFKKFAPDVVINTAAYHNVAECEKNDLKAFMVNGLGPKYLAQSCLDHNSVLVHISTDYVFDGKKNMPYTEEDLPNPLNVYGITKLAGEYYVKATMERYFIVRTSGLYGMRTCRAKGGNFIDTMLRLCKEQKTIKVVGDEVLTPTYTFDLAAQINDLVKTASYGIYHVTNEGCCSWYEFAKEIFSFLEANIDLQKISQRDFPSNVKRPRYSVLENKCLESLGINRMRHWKDALRSYLTAKIR